jgi:hypothetical protein
LFVDHVATEADADFEMYAFFLLCFSFSHFVRSDWIKFLSAYMVGAARYGLPVGRRLKESRLTVSTDIVTYKEVCTWIEYPLIPPHFMIAYPNKTCFICSIVIAVAPDLVTLVPLPLLTTVEMPGGILTARVAL